MKLQDRHRQYLLRTSRALSSSLGRSVRPAEVLEAILDMAIRDENVYDPEDGRPMSTSRKEVVSSGRTCRLGSLELGDLLRAEEER